MYEIRTRGPKSPKTDLRPAIRIGTSGWSYPHWRGPFYPTKLATKHWFAHYAEHFDTVEVNNTFYRLPEEKTFLHWKESAPPGFLFTLKMNRTVTHLKKLRDVESPLESFLGRARLLEQHLGPILIQLPPRWRRDLNRLEGFLAQLPTDMCVALEFRDPSWFTPETYALMDRFNIAFCRHDMVGISCPRINTGHFRYIRLHGPAGKYGGRYTRQQLKSWENQIIADVGNNTTFVYFNNDEEGHAVKNALELRNILQNDLDTRSRPVGPGS